MIETRTALDNLDVIAGTPGIDALFRPRTSRLRSNGKDVNALSPDVERELDRMSPPPRRRARSRAFIVILRNARSPLPSAAPTSGGQQRHGSRRAMPRPRWEGAEGLKTPELAHDPEKLTDFSDKIMRQTKKIESRIDSNQMSQTLVAAQRKRHEIRNMPADRRLPLELSGEAPVVGQRVP